MQESDSKRSRQTFDETFKKEAVSVFQSSKKSLKQVALELGVHENNLRNWIEKYAPKESESDGPSVQELQSEVRRLRKELAERAEEVTILKKSDGLLCNPNKTLRYKFVARHTGEHRIDLMCRVLQVSVSATMLG